MKTVWAYIAIRYNFVTQLIQFLRLEIEHNIQVDLVLAITVLYRNNQS